MLINSLQDRFSKLFKGERVYASTDGQQFLNAIDMDPPLFEVTNNVLGVD
jgi:hypothetical protein